MGKKINPVGLRLGINSQWRSRWFNRKQAPVYLQEDAIIRAVMRKLYNKVGIDALEIERAGQEKTKIQIHSSRPGIIIGREGKGLRAIKEGIEKGLRALPFYRQKGKKLPYLEINVIEYKKPHVSAAILAQIAATEVEKRMPVRSIMKRTIFRATQNREVVGVRIRIAGRLNGGEIHRSEKTSYGTIPLTKLRAKIDYAEERALCPYGIIGVKVWVYQGQQS